MARTATQQPVTRDLGTQAPPGMLALSAKHPPWKARPLTKEQKEEELWQQFLEEQPSEADKKQVTGPSVTGPSASSSMVAGPSVTGPTSMVMGAEGVEFIPLQHFQERWIQSEEEMNEEEKSSVSLTRSDSKSSSCSDCD